MGLRGIAPMTEAETEKETEPEIEFTILGSRFRDIAPGMENHMDKNINMTWKLLFRASGIAWSSQVEHDMGTGLIHRVTY